MQFGTITMASAAADTDLRIQGNRDFANQAIDFKICNDGITSIKQIVVGVSAANISYESGYVNPFPSAPVSNPGIFDVDALTWNGEVRTGECIELGLGGVETGNLGDTVTTTINIISATQVDDTANSDINPGNEELILSPFTIVELPDLKAESYIVTTGPITATTEVEYQIDVSNTGTGIYNDNGFNIFAFTLPADATFVGVTDVNPDDGIDADNSTCFPAGVLGVDIVLPGLGSYSGRTVVVCQLGIVGGTIPVGDTIYPFRIQVTAGATMAAGNADVVGILEGNDKGTYELFSAIASGENIEDTLDINPNNNIFRLTYDPSALNATVARCAGQGELTTDGTGCFTVTFNKKILASSFGEDDINLGGNGAIDSLIQIDDFTWELKVKNITPGSTLTFLLNLNQIQDYSAQQNTTQVLGVNTIRYDVGSTPSNPSSGVPAGTNSAAGTLAATGNNTTIAIIAVVLILLGLGCSIAGRKKISG